MTNPNRQVTETLSPDDFALLSDIGHVPGREAIAKRGITPENADISVGADGSLSVSARERVNGFGGFVCPKHKWLRTTKA